MCITCKKSKKHADTLPKPAHLSNIEAKIANKVSDGKKNIKNIEGRSLTNEKNIQKTTENYINLRNIAAQAAEERLEKNKNRGISAPGKLSAKLEAEKKKTRSMLLDDIIKEKQIEKGLQKKDLQVFPG
ncbi:hypothetical protein PMAC_002873 [Pneumocystis sp. 'macacae']|nr:hypothetical protein PMAC_002873 [Pneumocystis sp. 'macacae']